MTIYLIRHGESLSDVNQRYDGDYDDPLTPAGIAQAQTIAQSPLLTDIQAIYTSTKIRAQQTAEILHRTLNIPVTTVSGLAEQDIYGAFLDLAKDQPEEEYRRLGEVLVNKDTAYPGTETYQEFKERVLESFEVLLRLDYEQIAIITHGGPIRCIFRELIPSLSIQSLGNGCVIELELGGTTLDVTQSMGVIWHE